jgi:hypothetical protein
LYHYFEIIFGIILVLIFSIILGLVAGSLGSYLGFLVATILVGYRRQGDLVNGALWGASCAVLAGMVFLASMFLMELFGGLGPGASMMEMGFLALIIGLMVDGLIGSVGGALGWFLWTRNI